MTADRSPHGQGCWTDAPAGSAAAAPATARRGGRGWSRSPTPCRPRRRRSETAARPPSAPATAPWLPGSCSDPCRARRRRRRQPPGAASRAGAHPGTPTLHLRPAALIQPAAQLLQAALLLEPLRLAVVPPYSAAATTPRLPHGDRQTRPQALDRAA